MYQRYFLYASTFSHSDRKVLGIPAPHILCPIVTCDLVVSCQMKHHHCDCDRVKASLIHLIVYLMGRWDNVQKLTFRQHHECFAITEITLLRTLQSRTSTTFWPYNRRGKFHFEPRICPSSSKLSEESLRWTLYNQR